MYPWPFGEFDNRMDDALNIAMDYLMRSGQAAKFKPTQTIAATAIASAWRAGERKRVKLTNYAIRAVERKDTDALVKKES
jgi:hypothetical protein